MAAIKEVLKEYYIIKIDGSYAIMQFTKISSFSDFLLDKTYVATYGNYVDWTHVLVVKKQKI